MVSFPEPLSVLSDIDTVNVDDFEVDVTSTKDDEKAEDSAEPVDGCIGSVSVRATLTRVPPAVDEVTDENCNVDVGLTSRRVVVDAEDSIKPMDACFNGTSVGEVPTAVELVAVEKLTFAVISPEDDTDVGNSKELLKLCVLRAPSPAEL